MPLAGRVVDSKLSAALLSLSISALNGYGSPVAPSESGSNACSVCAKYLTGFVKIAGVRLAHLLSARRLRTPL